MSAPSFDDLTAETVCTGLDIWGIEYSQNQIEQVVLYRDLLIDWNANKMNLTRIVEPKAVGTQHFLDSLAILKYCTLKQGSTLLDVGTGAGFPGLALKIFRPDLKLTLLEATAKKLTFCSAVCDALGLDNVELIHGRAETKPSPIVNRTFDTITARAVADLSLLAAWCEPYLRSRPGQLIALKGAKAAEELDSAGTVLRKLHLKAELIEADIPGSDHVHNIIRCMHTTGGR